MSEAAVASTSKDIPSRFNRGTHHPANNQDRWTKKKVKFVLSSSSKKQNHFYDESAEDRDYKVTYIGYKYIQDLTAKKPHEIICEITKSNSPFATFLNEPELEAEWLMHVVEILRSMCSSSFTGNINEMLNHVLRSRLMHALVYYLSDVENERDEKTLAKMKTFMEHLTELLSSITNTLPLIAVERDVKKVITKTIDVIDKVNDKFQTGVDDTFKDKLQTLTLKIDSYKAMWEQKVPSSRQPPSSYEDKLSKMAPPDDFRTISLHPTYDDLKGGHQFVFIRPNKVKGAYRNVEHYLDVQFRLLREDFVYPLRTGLKAYTEAKAATRTDAAKRLKSKYENVRFYRDTKFEGRTMTKSHELGYVLAFDPHRRLRIVWEYSKRFMFGSLLLFTTNDFQTFFYGTVLERDEKYVQAGRILVKLPLSVEISESFFEREYLLVESEVLFEPYFHVMRRLQTFKEDDFPMPKYIVFGETGHERPAYMEKLQALTIEDLKELQLKRSGGLLASAVIEPGETLLSEAKSWNVLGHPVDLTRNDQWPTAAELQFDESQYEAFKTALTSNFCVIQGPPGTGKTFLGLKIAQVLLENMQCPRSRVTRIRPPILVVCYTNHALDQFLEGIVPFTRKIVRAGSRSKSELLKEFNLRGQNQIAVRKEARNVHFAMSSVVSQVEHLHREIQRLTKMREEIEKPRGILEYELIEGVMDDQQKEYLKGKRDLRRWLLPPVYEKFNNNESWYDEKIVFQYDRGAWQAEEEKNPATDAESPDDDQDESDLVDELLNFEIPHLESLFCVQFADFENIQADYDQQIWRIEQKMTQETDRKALSKLMNERRGTYFSFRRKVREYELLRDQMGKSRFDAEQCAMISQKNIRHLSMDERWLLYWSWVKKLMEMTAGKLNANEKEYAAKLVQLNEYKQIEDVYVVQRAHVLGMTTTCAARLHHVLETLKPAVGEFESGERGHNMWTSSQKGSQLVVFRKWLETRTFRTQFVPKFSM